MPNPPPTVLDNVASTLHAVPQKYDQFFIHEQHVSEDAPSWAHFFFVYSCKAFGRASVECMKESALFFYVLKMVFSRLINATRGDVCMRWRMFLLIQVILFAGAIRAMNNVEGSGEKQSVNESQHLGIIGRINLGSYYTPAKYVRLVAQWLLDINIGKGWTIADLSSGYGAFFELQSVKGLNECRYIGNDIDNVAVSKGREYFPFVEWSVENALFQVSRKKFNIADNENLIIVGNPPYNDVTSQFKKDIKSDAMRIDSDIRTRDIGISSLLAYDKLKASYVVVLHPLSYLIKRSNYNAGKRFFKNYRMVKHIIFPSDEFAGTSKASAFPVIVALYKREEDDGLTYKDVTEKEFKTIGGEIFSISKYEYVGDFIQKYPHKKRFKPEILFYTMRDINALKRSRTFIEERIVNAVDVDPDKLAYYCYIDCFKRFAEIPYYLGNFNVPFDSSNFDEIKEDVVSISKSKFPKIFKGDVKSSEVLEAEVRVRKYIKKVLSK